MSPCGHHEYWIGNYGSCMACCVEKAEAERDNALRLLATERDRFGKIECELAKELKEAREIAEKAREALENLHDLFDEEIKTRCAGLPEHKVQKLRIVSMLQLPRNMAKSALAIFPKEPSDNG